MSIHSNDEEPVKKKQKVQESNYPFEKEPEEEDPTLSKSEPSTTVIKKANEVFEFMRSKRLSIADFVSAIPYVTGNGRRQEVIVQSLFQNEDVLMNLLFRKNFDVDFSPLCNVLGAKLLEELKNIQQNNSLFGKFKMDGVNNKEELVSKSFANLEIGKGSVEALYKQAPLLTKLFNELLSNTTLDQDSTKTRDDSVSIESSDGQPSSVDNRLILILSVLCYSRNKKKSTNLPVLFGLYLNSLGLTTKRGLQIFNKFGISVNQKSIGDILDELSRAESALNTSNKNPDRANPQISNSNNTQKKSATGPLVLPFTQNIISSTNDAYKSTSEVLKISDAKFNQLFDQYTNNTSTDNDHIDPKISNEMQQTPKTS